MYLFDLKILEAIYYIKYIRWNSQQTKGYWNTWLEAI